MDNYLPFNLLTIYMISLIGLMLKTFVTYNKYILVKIGRLKSPYRLTIDKIKKNLGLYFGVDLKARAKALGATFAVFSSSQKTQIEADLAKRVRKGLFYAALSAGVNFVGIFFAGGQVIPLLLVISAAIAVAIWGATQS